MSSGALHKGDITLGSPYKQPIPGIANMAFFTSRPRAAQRVHPMPALELGNGCRAVFDNEIDDPRERSIIDVLPVEPFEISLEC